MYMYAPISKFYSSKIGSKKGSYSSLTTHSYSLGSRGLAYAIHWMSVKLIFYPSKT